MSDLSVLVLEPIDALRTPLLEALATVDAVVVDESGVVSGTVVVCALSALGDVDTLITRWARHPVVALVEGPSWAGTLDLHERGVRATVERGEAPAIVVAAVLMVSAGYGVVPPDVTLPAPASMLMLSSAELRWLCLFSQGQRIRQVADVEGCSEREMYRRLRRLYSKMGVGGKSQALTMIEDLHLLDHRSPDAHVAGHAVL